MSQPQYPIRFRVLCGNGNCFGPALPPILTEVVGEVSYLPDTRYLLLKTLRPVSYLNDQIDYIVISSHYAGTSLEDLCTQGGAVGVARVRPKVQIDLSKELQKEDVNYIAIGRCELVEEG